LDDAMKIACGLAGALALTALTVAASTAASSSHDTCTVTGNGTSYTLQITIPKGAPVQRGFAFVSPGVTISNLDVGGLPGNPATSGLSRGASAEWVVTGQAPPGTFTANLQTSGEPKGSFTVEAAGRKPKSFYAPVTCRRVGGAVSNTFSAAASATYNASTRSWTETVTVPGPGTVTYVQVFTKNGGPLITQGPPPKQLIEGNEVNVTRAGRVALALKPTAAGTAALEKGSPSIYLSLSYKPTNAVPQARVLALRLRR
jgi:hypothetical protein